MLTQDQKDNLLSREQDKRVHGLRCQMCKWGGVVVGGGGGTERLYVLLNLL